MTTSDKLVPTQCLPIFHDPVSLGRIQIFLYVGESFGYGRLLTKEHRIFFLVQQIHDTLCPNSQAVQQRLHCGSLYCCIGQQCVDVFAD